ncbi:MAG: heavy metal translocating P-type ATPase, partial [Phycisphaerales bacterium]
MPDATATNPAPSKPRAPASGLAGIGERLFSPRAELTAAIVAAALLLCGWVLDRLGAWSMVGPALVWISFSIGAVYGARAAIESLRKGVFDIDVLMFVGAVLAAFIGAPAEGAMLLVLFSVSGALEELAMERTLRSVEALHALMPTDALRLNEQGEATRVPPESLVAGDRVRVLPGELIPADGRLNVGTSSVDQATLTGESMPRDVGPGDEVFAGTLNVGDPIELAVLRPAAQSSLQKIVDLVTRAQQQRQPVQRLIDRVSQPYALTVFAASLLVLFIWRFALGAPWIGSAAEAGRDGAVYIAITLLIVASPCALQIATPTATLAAISRAAKGGVLFKGGQAIERLSRLRAIAFDKTGTLTVGRPRVLEVHAVGWSDGQRLLAVAAGLEEHSTHPIAHAVVDHARAQGVEPMPLEAVKYVTGRGVVGLVSNADGARSEARLGSLTHTLEIIPECLRANVRSVLDRVQRQGQIAVVCAHAGQAGVFILEDAVRPGAACLVERLHGLGVMPVVMLTGDNERTAAKVAGELGIDRFHAQLLPADKVTHVARLRREIGDTRTGHVGVIGDGVNDAPALAAADVSLAIGSIGSDAALESADI